jgi:integrase
MIRLAAYTGLRCGELVTLKWRDFHWGERVLVVERALSGGAEGTTKSRRARYVPLADQALGALNRLSRRPNFVSADDYVFAGPAGDRLDDSTIRRRYVYARDAAGLPPLRYHDLRPQATSSVSRELRSGRPSSSGFSRCAAEPPSRLRTRSELAILASRDSWSPRDHLHERRPSRPGVLP